MTKSNKVKYQVSGGVRRTPPQWGAFGSECEVMATSAKKAEKKARKIFYREYKDIVDSGEGSIFIDKINKS